MPLEGRRRAHFAGRWYEGDPEVLSAWMDLRLDAVPDTIDGISLPVPGARVIIAPHAGYDYSGACAAWAYKSLDLSAAKRVFILGPSHQYGLPGCALTTFAEWNTPFGPLEVDQTIMSELESTGNFSEIPSRLDLLEHSMELHTPYLWKRLEQTHQGDTSKWPTIVPILVGSTRRSAEKKFGDILLPYLKDPENAFIVSSDFCHWGAHFDYRPHFSVAAAVRRHARRHWNSSSATGEEVEDKGGQPVKLDPKDGTEPWPILVLTAGAPRDPKDMPFEESITVLDEQAITAIKTGVHDNFVENLSKTHNTVCGRHPIGVMMAALEGLREEQQAPDESDPTTNGDASTGPEDSVGRGIFKFVQYDRSWYKEKQEREEEQKKRIIEERRKKGEDITAPVTVEPVLMSGSDSSVSYVSAYTIP